ncbi:hypothetical protein JCM19235_1299 [Vibrio maritimus]|uniref:Lipoprotein n=1 Tax=Vibrio maritimus TaxID=990268 RepID=A0A090S8A3_9VIBR|nr:hypothetical protein JCM19235_1299 [Vibrio maritimus]
MRKQHVVTVLAAVTLSGCAGIGTWNIDLPITNQQSDMITIEADQSKDYLQLSQRGGMQMGVSVTTINAPSVEYIASSLQSDKPVSIRVDFINVDLHGSPGAPTKYRCFASSSMNGQTVTSSMSYEVEHTGITSGTWVPEGITPCLDRIASNLQTAIDQI